MSQNLSNTAMEVTEQRVNQLVEQLQKKHYEALFYANQYLILQQSMRYQVGSLIINCIRNPFRIISETGAFIKYVSAWKSKRSMGVEPNRVLRAIDFEGEVVNIALAESAEREARVKEILLELSDPIEQSKFLYKILDFYIDLNSFVDATVYAEQAYRLDESNAMTVRKLIGLYNRTGNITKRYDFIRRMIDLGGKMIGNEHEMAEAEHRLYKTRWEWKRDVQLIPRGQGILNVLNKYYPEVNGYTVRSYEIVNQQKLLGLEPSVVTKLGWVAKGEKGGIVEKEGVRHHYLMLKEMPAISQVPMDRYFDEYADIFYEKIMMIRPSVIHAASNFQNALPALQVAKKAGIPSVYEVRGMWHHTQSSKVEGFEGSERYQLHEDYELYCCEIADRVVTICQSLCDYLVDRGIPRGKITIIPNAVDINEFSPVDKDHQLINQYGLEGHTVLGFIGSVTVYEGLKYLLQSIAMLVAQKARVKLIIVGDGPILPELKQLSVTLNISNHVIFTGRVPRQEVKRYYSIIDIFPFPRTKDKVCELVTPLKPYEAMAMGKLVAVSGISALKEMVIDGETGLVFEAENVESLTQTIKLAIEQEKVASQGLDWVRRNRDWNKVAIGYKEVYLF